MNASTMMQREQFQEVLFATIRRYYAEKKKIVVNLSETAFRNAKKMYIYHTPVFISSAHLSKGAKEFLYIEYNIRGSFIKFCLGKLGVFVIAHSGGLLSKGAFYIGSSGNLEPDLFISPCNRTIRFYHFEDDTVDCIIKEGYGLSFFENHVNFRMNALYSFVPKILDHGSTWYSEKIMHGHALARMRNRKEHESALNTALAYLQQLAEDTLHVMSSDEYINKIFLQVDDLLQKIYGDGHTEKNTIFHREKWEERLRKMPVIDVPLCTSHGDFQEGNIWVQRDGKVIIYDWETCGERSVWYDPTTLFFGLRNKPFSVELKEFLRSDARCLLNDPGKQYSKAEYSVMANILVLEDLVFMLAEAAELSDKYRVIRADSVIDLLVQSEYCCGEQKNA